MPIVYKNTVIPQGDIAMWKVVEDDDFFYKNLQLTSIESKFLMTMRPARRTEWLSSRYLIHSMSGRYTRAELKKDIHGKPHFPDSNHHISISHSRDMTAAIASEYIVGIDVQYIVSKIEKIAPKFVSKKEFKLIDTGKAIWYYHLIWGAKESLFKAYGQGNVDFRKNLHILEIDEREGNFNAKAKVIKDDFRKSFDIKGFIFNDYILVYAIHY